MAFTLKPCFPAVLHPFLRRSRAQVGPGAAGSEIELEHRPAAGSLRVRPQYLAAYDPDAPAAGSGVPPDATRCRPVAGVRQERPNRRRSIREFVAGLRFSPEAENRDSCFVSSREGQTTGVVMTRFMVVTSWAAGGHLGTNLTNSQRDLMQTS